MKKAFFLFTVCVSIKVIGQNNIGIGISSPQAKLHVLNGFRVGGTTNYLTYDSSGKFILNNSSVFVPLPQYLMQHSNSAEGLYFGNDQLEYRYQDGTPRFLVNATNSNGYFFGKLGLGTQTPLTAVHMAAVTGSKMIFYGDSATANVGIDVQPYRFQFHTDDTYSSIAFGYGSSNNFTENMRISSYGAVGIGTAPDYPYGAIDVRKIAALPTARFQGTQYSSIFNTGTAENTYVRGGKNNSRLIINELTGGKVGIGVYPDSGPSENYLVDVNGRLLIRSGGLLANTAGTWFSSGTANEGFIGMENDNYIGFYGATAGWKFGMNTQTGALKINGSEGTAGQVLTSNGPNASATWSSPTQELYSNTIALNATATNSLFYFWDTIPGTVYTFTTSGNAVVLARYNFCIKGLDCDIYFGADGRHRSVYLTMDIDGSVSSFPNANYHTLECDHYTQVTGTFCAKVNAGTHTLMFGGGGSGSLGPTTAVVQPHSSPFTSQAVVQIFRE
jgi:hypothetical protein